MRQAQGAPRGPLRTAAAGGAIGAGAHPASVDRAAWVDAGGGPRGLRALRLASEVAALPGALVRHRGVVLSGVRRELRARFGTTTLGWIWPLLRPLALVTAYALLFTALFGARAGAEALAPPELGAYMACGVLVWSAASESLLRAALSITDHAGLVKRQRFLTELLPLQAVLVEHLVLLAGLACFVAVGATLAALGIPGGAVPGAVLLVGGPAALGAGLVLTYGLGLALAALQVVVRDTQHALGVALTFGMFATPVFWVPSPEALPAIEPWLSWIEANPLHQLLVAWRGALLGGLPLRAVLASSGYVLACGTALLIAGHALFRHLAPEFADEV